MATLDPSIILAGQQPNYLAQLVTGQQAGQARTDAIRGNQFNAMLQQQGPGILAGDQNALNQLAQYDPTTALQVQQTQQTMRFDREAMEVARKAAADATAKALKDEQTAAAAAAELKQVKPLYLQAAAIHQSGDMAALGQFLQSSGLAQMGVTPEAFPMFAAQVKGVSDGIELAVKMKPQAPEWRAATPQEAAQFGAQAGQINVRTGQFKEISVDSSLAITTNPDGTMSFIQGPGAGMGEEVTGGAALAANAMAPETMIASIDEIMNDPSLSRVVGPIMGGGGNDVTEFGMAQRIAYGGEGLALIQKIAQLENTTWLAARDMLKGGGAITDFESKKAEGAMSRLKRATTEVEFNRALSDLKSAIEDGAKKLGVSLAPQGETAGAADFSAMPFDQLLAVDPMALSLEELQAYNKAISEAQP